MDIKAKIQEIKKSLEPLAIPTKEDEETLTETAQEIKAKISSLVDDEVEIVFCGSYAKGTWLRGSEELDIFLRFPLGYTEKEMIEYLKKRLMAPLNLSVRHASRDYLHGRFKGVEIEVIPVYKIEDPKQAKHIMDFTYFHTKYINQVLSKEEKNEVRILKKYLKTINCYGAESHIEGFSGYVCELLISTYKTFERTLLSLISSRQPIFIDPAKYYDDLEKAKVKLKEKIKDCPLIIIDPIFEERNASKSLSKETFTKFIVKTLINIDVLPKPKELRSITLEANKFDDELIVASKLKSITKKIVSELTNNKYYVLYYDVFIKDKIVSEIKYYDLDFNEIIEKEGPKLWMLDAMVNFINKNKSNIYGYVPIKERFYFFLGRDRNIDHILSNRIKSIASNSKYTDLIDNLVIKYE